MVLMRTRGGHRQPPDEQGAVAVMTAMVMVVLVLFAAIVVDLGNARDVRRQSQNAADASSLAGANMLYPASGVCLSGTQPCITDAVAAAKSYALDNFQVSANDWDTCTAPAGSALAVPSAGTSCISFDSATSPTLVRVYVPTRTVPTFFGRIAGVTSIPVGSSSQAQLGTAVNCSLCFLGSVNAGNGDFSVIGGSVAVNGNVAAGPQSFWSAQSISVVGTVSGGTFTPPATTAAPFGDPLANSTSVPPSTSGPGALTARTNPCALPPTGGPGLYAGSFTQLSNASCTLQPGLYVIDGSWGMKNNDLLSGTGVTLYVRSPNGALDFKNGNVAITPPATGQPNAGYAIIYDRDNANNIGLQGNGATSITGVVYAPKSILDFNGNSCFGFSGGPVILNGAITNGNQSCVTIDSAKDTTVFRKLLHLNQ